LRFTKVVLKHLDTVSPLNILFLFQTGEQELCGNHILPDVFHWKGGRKADTTGLSLLNEPFLVEIKEFGKVIFSELRSGEGSAL